MNRIKELRIKKDLTQDDVAKAIDVLQELDKSAAHSLDCI